MILPNNGKIIIIDDEEKDVESLMAALKKEKMSFLFYSDQGGDDLPENGPIRNVRLVFLDLDLGIGDSFNQKQKVRIVQERMVKLIEPNTPYILVIWSTHEDTLLRTLIQDFSGHFKEYEPIVRCSFDKQETINGGHPNPVQIIRDKLKNELSEFEAFNAFLLWESIVNQAVGRVTNDFISVFKIDQNWDKNVKNALYKIAFAELGSALIQQYDDVDKLKLGIKIINASLIEHVENDINAEFDKLQIKNIRQGGEGLDNETIIKLNTAIHVIKSNGLIHFAAGNLYISDFTNQQKEKLNEIFKDSQLDEIKKSNLKRIHLDITPTCDYSNPKQFSRVIEGILYDEKFGRKAVKPSDFIYKECPVLNIVANDFMIFDFRTLSSYTKTEFEKQFTDLPVIRLRDKLLLDVQAQLSNHINRPGIFSLKN